MGWTSFEFEEAFVFLLHVNYIKIDACIAKDAQYDFVKGGKYYTHLEFKVGLLNYLN